jgi:hypothetical protein
MHIPASEYIIFPRSLEFIVSKSTIILGITITCSETVREARMARAIGNDLVIIKAWQGSIMVWMNVVMCKVLKLFINWKKNEEHDN